MWFYLAAALIAAGLYFLFKDTLNRLQYIGPIYWITRDNGSLSEPRFARAFMRGTAPPWKIGKGIQFRLFYYTVQVGICHNAPLKDPDDYLEGLMYVLGAEDMNLTVEEIRALP